MSLSTTQSDTANALCDMRRDDIESFLKEYCDDELSALWTGYPGEKRGVWVDYHDLLQAEPGLADIVVGEHHEYSYSDLKGALERAIGELPNPIDTEVDAGKIEVRIHNLGEGQTLQVGEYYAEDLGKYVSVTGQISKATPVRPKYDELAFRCVRCETLTRVPQVGDTQQDPEQCRSCERQGPFIVDDERSRAVDHQLLRIEELPEQVRGDDADTIDVEVEGRLVRHLSKQGVKGGSRVTVSGILGTDQGDGVVADNWLLDAHAVEVEEDDLNADDITQEEREEIEAFASGEKGDPFELLAESIVPTLMGHETIEQVEYDGEVKTKYWWIKTLGSLATLFQGYRKPRGDGTFIRGTSHMLLIGDPSTGKSTFMQAIERLSPRSASTSGKGTSAAGLTAAAVQDDFTNGWNLEAGVLVKAHGGVATIDEIDKIKPEAVESMHTALERQQINVSKAGIHATLPCETSVLASGNPEDSRFTDYANEIDQIDLVSSLLDRFDIVFTLRDVPDEDRDADLAEHVIDDHIRAAEAARGDVDDATPDSDAPIEPELLVKWVKIAREIKPKIRDQEVARELRDFYVDIRQANDDDGPVPATVRNLDGVLRMAEAAARFRLSETVEMQDLALVVPGLKASLTDIGYDPETGAIDIDTAQGNTSWSQRDRVAKIKGLADQLDTGDGAEVEELLDLAESAGIDREKAESTLDRLRQQRELYEPATGRVSPT